MPCRVVVLRTTLVPDEDVTTSTSEVVNTDSTLDVVVRTVVELVSATSLADGVSLACSPWWSAAGEEGETDCVADTEVEVLLLVLVEKRDGLECEVVLG